MNFKPGDKIYCVNADFDTTQPNFTEAFLELPVEDVLYICRENDNGRVLLEEIVNPVLPFMVGDITIMIESGFAASRFVKPLTDRNELTDALLESISEDIGVEKIVNPDWYAPEEAQEELEEIDHDQYKN